MQKQNSSHISYWKLWVERFDGNVAEGKIEKYPWKSLIYERQRTLCQTLESSQWHQWPFRKLIERKHLRKWDCSINLQYWNHIQNYPHLWKTDPGYWVKLNEFTCIGCKFDHQVLCTLYNVNYISVSCYITHFFFEAKSKTLILWS